MESKYRIGHKPHRRRRTRVLIVLGIVVLIFGALAAIVFYDLRQHRDTAVTGTSRSVAQTSDENGDKFRVDQPTFSMELPSDWKQIASKNATSEHSITWQAGKKGQDNRYMTLYIDIIPTTRSINRLVPVLAQGSTLSVGDVSENCATFTKGGTLDAGQATQLSDAPAKYKTVDFLCDLSRINDNEVGSGSTEGINTVTIKGQDGAHKYFFLYTEHNIQPDYSIFYNALKSFRAK